MTNGRRPFTLVSFHAHPDDEALLTGGTLARAAAEGHRVVVVVATAGEAGLADARIGTQLLGARRTEELAASARAIGAARVEILGHADSGSGPVGRRDDPPGAPRFADVDPEIAAAGLAQILAEEHADVVTTYDASGGYGHPDHRQVHRVGALAARAVGTPVVLEATVDREAFARAVRLLRVLARITPMPALPDPQDAFVPRAELTHAVDVRGHLPAKLWALRAHLSQGGGGDGLRTIALLLRLPPPVRRKVLGTEWFREVGRQPSGLLLDDVFATLRG